METETEKRTRTVPLEYVSTTLEMIRRWVNHISLISGDEEIQSECQLLNQEITKTHFANVGAKATQGLAVDVPVDADQSGEPVDAVDSDAPGNPAQEFVSICDMSSEQVDRETRLEIVRSLMPAFACMLEVERGSYSVDDPEQRRMFAQMAADLTGDIISRCRLSVADHDEFPF